MSDYSFMRSGFSTLAEPTGPQWTEQDWKVAQAALLVFTEDSMVMAKQYAAMQGHDSVLPQDMVDCLKAKTREGLESSTDLEARIQEFQTMMEEDQPDTDDMLYAMDDQAAPDVDDDILQKVRDHVESWNEWEPQNDIEHILKNAVNNTENAFLHGRI
jgi:hypothetical protein